MILYIINNFYFNVIPIKNNFHSTYDEDQEHNQNIKMKEIEEEHVLHKVIAMDFKINQILYDPLSLRK